MPWRSAHSQFEMTPRQNETEILADRAPHNLCGDCSCPLGLRSRGQAHPGQHPTAAIQIIAYWNRRSLGVN